jgi:FtsX-like permease family
MRSIAFRYWLELRRSWRSWSVLALVCGIAAALPIAIAANARRTDTALPRLLSNSGSANAVVSADASRLGLDGANAFLAEVDALPAVAASGHQGGVFISRIAPDGSIDPTLQTGSATGKLLDDAALDIGRFDVISGRMPTTGRADETVANAEFLRITGYHVGDTVTDLRLFRLEDLDEESFEPDPAKGTQLSLTIVGEVRRPEDYLDEPSERVPQIYLLPAFGAKYPNAAFYINDYVRLADGDRAVDQFHDDVITISSRYSPEQPLVVIVRDGVDAAQGALRPQILASWLLCLVLAVVTIVIAAQAISRRLADSSRNFATLHALGTTRAGLFGLGLAQATALAIGAAIVAPLLAFLSSALTPLGSSSEIEPSPGLRLDAGVLVLGAAATAVALVVIAMIPAWRFARDAASPATTLRAGRAIRPSRTVTTLANAGAGPATVTGVRFAIQAGRERFPAPTRSVLLGVGLAVGVLTTGLAFHADLDRLLHVPRLHGWDWDVEVANQFGSIPDEGMAAFRERPEVADLAGFTFGSLVVDGQSVPAVGIDQIDGTVFPTLDEGRVARSDDEIVLGSLTLRSLHRSVGDTVQVVTRGGPRKMQIVGRATFPTIGNVRFSGTGAGSGAAVTVDNLPSPADDIGGRFSGIFARLDPSLDHDDAVASLREFLFSIGCTDTTCVVTDALPVKLKGYPNLRSLVIPFTLVLELMFAISLAHGVFSSIAFRRRELWILSAIGVDRRQTGAILVGQALTIAVGGLVIGLVGGMVAERLAWRAFTHNFGLETPASTPFVRLGVMSTATLALAVVLALAALAVIGQRRDEDRRVEEQL